MEALLESLVNSESECSVIIQFLIMLLVSIVPFAPIPVLATIIGANHSLLTGLIINLGGTVAGSLILFMLSKNLLRQLSEKILFKYSIYKQFITLIQRNGFLAVLIGRLVPVIPSAGINLIAGISGVTFVAFFSATILGKLPTVFAFSIAGNHLAVGKWNTALLVFLYLIVLLLISQKVKNKWYGN